MTFAEAAMIMMSGESRGVIKPLNVTANGKYNAVDHGCDGYSPVNVNVPDRYEEGLTDGRKSLLEFEDGKAPPKEVDVSTGTLIIDNAIDEADADLALSMMLKYDKYASGKPEQYPDRMYSLSVEPYCDERSGDTYDWIVAYTTQLTSSGTVEQYRYGVISSATWHHDGDSRFTSIGYDPATNNMILTIEREYRDGTIDTIGPTTWSADVYGVYFQALLNGATVGSLPHI